MNKIILSLLVIFGLMGLITFYPNPSIESYQPDQTVVYQPNPITLMRTITPQVIAYTDDGKQMWSGSGVWIDNKHLLTAGHVAGKGLSLEDMPSYWMIGTHKATTAAIDVAHDVAMLTIDGFYYGPVADISHDKLNLGDDVVCVGWMIDLGKEITWGKIANLKSDQKGWGEGDLICSITCTYGASGGPVFKNGKVIGIVSRGEGSLLVVEPIVTFGLEIK